MFAAATGPPRGLGTTATMYWNIDALVGDKFGAGRVCVQHYNTLVRSSSSYCDTYYTRLFPAAHQSTFRLVTLSRNPVANINVLPIVLPAFRAVCELRQRPLAGANECA